MTNPIARASYNNTTLVLFEVEYSRNDIMYYLHIRKNNEPTRVLEWGDKNVALEIYKFYMSIIEKL